MKLRFAYNKVGIQAQKTKGKSQHKLCKRNLHNTKKLQQQTCALEFQITKND
jgi:hypothetical protein